MKKRGIKECVGKKYIGWKCAEGKYLKRILLFAMIAALLLCGACGKGPKEQGTEENKTEGAGPGETVAADGTAGKSLYEHGLEVVALMAEMAGSKEYVELYTSSPELREILSSVGAGDFGEPSDVYRVRAMEGIGSVLDMAKIDSLSDELRANVASKMFAALATQINSMEGTAALAASSLCTAEKLFVSGELTGNEIYLYVYENAVPVAVTFTKGENGAVAARGIFILYEEFPAIQMEEAAEFLKGFGVEVERIEEK